MTRIRTRAVLQAALLQALRDHPEGLFIRNAYEVVESRHTFPEEWLREIPASTGYDDLERLGVKWREIPQEELVQMVPTEPQWQNEIRWARNDIRKQGWLDESAIRGVWRLNEEGRIAASQALSALSTAERAIATPQPSPQTSNGVGSCEPSVPLGRSTRERLEGQLALIISSMPLDDLGALVDIARVLRLRALRK